MDEGGKGVGAVKCEGRKANIINGKKGGKECEAGNEGVSKGKKEG